MFKGTRTRTARDIAVETNRLGGNLDAYTTHEMTGFTTKVADTALSQAIDLLADLISHPRFEQEDLEREQKVILEEMKMVEDTPTNSWASSSTRLTSQISRLADPLKAPGKRYRPSITKPP